MPPSTYYYQPHPAEDLDVREALEEIALEFPRYGYRRVTAELARRGWQVNHKRVQRLMREANLITEVQGYCRTTNSEHGYGRYPNLIKQLEIVRPDQVWRADLTYIRLPKQCVYLAVLLDVFTRSIRGWELAPHMMEILPKTALQRALQTHCPEIHHSEKARPVRGDGLCHLVAGGTYSDQYGSAWPTDRERL